MNLGRRPRARAPSGWLELVDAHAVAVHRHLDDVGLVGAEGGDRARVGRRLGDDHVTRIKQRLADQVDDLLTAGGDQDLVRIDVIPSAAMTAMMQPLTPERPSVGPYCSARAQDSAATVLIRAA